MLLQLLSFEGFSRLRCLNESKSKPIITGVISSGFALLLAMVSCSPAVLASSLPARDEDIYTDQVQLDLAELQQQQSVTFARDASAGSRGQGEGVVPAETLIKSRFSGTLNVDFRSQYIAYGIVLQPDGISTQPYLNLRYSLYDGKSDKDFFNNVTVFVTSWNDFSTNTNLSRPTSSFRNFTEADLIGGFSVSFAKRFNFAFSVTQLISPASAWSIGAFTKGVLSYDDTNQIASNFGLRPQLSLIYELPWYAQIGLQPNAFMLEPGITPNYTFNSKSIAPINISLPMRIGLGSKFYNGSTYGFFSIGPQVTWKLPFLSSSTYNTNLNLGYTFYNLGPTTTDFAPNGNSSQHVVNLGLGVNF